VLFHYIALAAACWYLCESFRRQWFKRRIGRAWYLLPVVVLTFTYGNFDGYESVWTKVEKGSGEPGWELEGDHGWDSDLKEHDRTVYHDARWRWSDEIYWRELTVWNAAGNERYTSRGPMTASNKPHGHWTGFLWSDFKTQNHWYWYGDEITEGEWHLRNHN